MHGVHLELGASVVADFAPARALQTHRGMTRLISRSLVLVFLLGSGCTSGDDSGGDDVAGCEVLCDSSCNSSSFGLSCESGPLSYSESCDYRYGPSGQVVAVDCDGSLTFEQSGNSYDYSSSWNGTSCSFDVDVTGVGTCHAP